MYACLKVLGQGQKWKGGDYVTAPGGGQKVRLLKTALEEMKKQDKIILFIERYSVFTVGAVSQCVK